MTQTKVIASNPAPKLFQSEKTCADCPKFQDYNDRGRGLCQVFDKVVRKQHQLTSDCQNAISSEELQEILDTHQAFLKPIAINFYGRNVYKQDPGYNSSSKIGYVGENKIGWFANDRHGLTVAEGLPNQSGALRALLDSFKPVESQDCRKPLDTESELDFDEPVEDLPHAEFEKGSIVKVIDEEEDHTEWASFVVVGARLNQDRFSSTESYLTEPDWLYLVASVDIPTINQFWVAENQICHAHQSDLIETADIF